MFSVRRSGSTRRWDVHCLIDPIKQNDREARKDVPYAHGLFICSQSGTPAALCLDSFPPHYALFRDIQVSDSCNDPVRIHMILQLVPMAIVADTIPHDFGSLVLLKQDPAVG